MPKPCHKPLKSNPFETYRDPVTGQWKVKYPDVAQPVVTGAASLLQAKDETPVARTPKRRHWKKSSRTRVA